MTERRTYSTEEVYSLVRGNLAAWAAVAIAFCTLPAATLYAAIPRFASTFKGFGADLPDGTMFLLHWPYLILIPSALVLLLTGYALTAPAQRAIAGHPRTVAAFAVLCCLSLIVQGLAVVALYLPVFRLGAVV